MRRMASAVRRGCVELDMNMYSVVDDAKIRANKPFRKVENGARTQNPPADTPGIKTSSVQIDEHCNLDVFEQFVPIRSILVVSI